MHYMTDFDLIGYDLIPSLMLLLGCIIIIIACISAVLNDSFDNFSWNHVTTWLVIIGSLLMIIGYISYKTYTYYHPYA